MGIRLEKNFHCIESDVSTLMQNIKTPTSLEELQLAKYEDSLELDIIDRSLRISAARWGRVCGYAQEQSGLAIQNLFPIKKNENEQISSSSNVDLELHTETAFHPIRPDVVCLLCVRGDSNAGTVYVLLEDLLNELSDDVIATLHYKLYYTSIDESFLSPGEDNKEIPTAILFENASQIVYDRALMSSHHSGGREMIRLLNSAIDKCKRTIYLETGDLLKIDNTKVIHGRTQFSPRYDGTDRWIKRAMVFNKQIPSDQLKVSAALTNVITTRL